jgi:hypothetical protein
VTDPTCDYCGRPVPDSTGYDVCADCLDENGAHAVFQRTLDARLGAFIQRLLTEGIPPMYILDTLEPALMKLKARIYGTDEPESRPA